MMTRTGSESSRNHLHNEKPSAGRSCRSWAAKLFLIVFFAAYILVGAYVFLIIETSSAHGDHHHTPPTEEIRTAAFDPTVVDQDQQQYEFMTRQALEKLWDITENLNILYKENWTRLASEEMGRLHDSMHQLMKKECAKRRNIGINNRTASGAAANGDMANPTSPLTTSSPAKAPVVKWTYPAAFFYVLSVITTLGSCPVIPESMESKVLTIIYAAFGIPLMLSYLTVMGSALSSCFRCCRIVPSGDEQTRRTVMGGSDGKLARLDYLVNSNHELYHQYRPSLVQQNKIASTIENPSTTSSKVSWSYWPVVFALNVIVLYILAGAWLFSSLVPLPWLDALLLSFMLFTTTSIPDRPSAIVWTGRNALMVATSFYVLIGLTLCSLCFHLIYEWLLARWTFIHSNSDQSVTSSTSSRRSSGHP